MKLDRALIKSQAKQLIKGNVFKLFLIAFVVILLTGAVTSFFSGISSLRTVFNSTNNMISKYSYDLDDYYNDFDLDDIDDFNFDNYIDSNPASSAMGTVSGGLFTGFGFSGLIAIFLAPLSISLAGLFLLLIRGQNLDLGDGFSYVFKNAFDKNYLQKVLTMFFAGIFTFLWSLLFLIPGIVYAYKIYFLSYIVADNPNMEWKEAIALSKKMTKGHKGELFVLTLSFIPWILLMPITLGLVDIYVIPYIQTVNALYYENFKQRGLQNGELTQLDFLSDAEKAAQSFQGGTYQPFANTNSNTVQQNSTYYQPIQSPVQPQQQNTYEQPATPQENTYQPLQENNGYQPPINENIE